MANLCWFWMFTNKTTIMSNNPEESYTEKKSFHESCGYSKDLGSLFDSEQDKHSFDRGRDWSQKFCEDLKKHAIKIINFEEKEMKPLTDSDISFMKSKKYVIYVKKSFIMVKMKKINLNYIKKLGISVIIQENLEELLIAFVI